MQTLPHILGKLCNEFSATTDFKLCKKISATTECKFFKKCSANFATKLMETAQLAPHLVHCLWHVLQNVQLI